MGTDILNRKDLIYQSAEKLFCFNGFTATSMRDIAQEVGIEAASLYSHIKSKDEILENICFKMAEKFLVSLDEVNDIYFNASEKLRMAIKLHVVNITDDMYAASVFLHEWRYLTEPKLSEFKKLRDKYQEGFREILQQGEDEGSFRIVEKKFAVITILSTLNSITEWYKPDGEMNPDEISDRLFSFIFTGLRK